MQKFSAEQKVYHIGNVEIGGQPGERPTVLIGSIFFGGHAIVRDRQKGLFDGAKAKALLEREAAAAEETGNPRVVDVIGDTSEALIRYLEFVAAHCDAPLLVDSPHPQARLEAVHHFCGSDVMPRLIYNSIDEHCTEEELATLRECGVKSAVLLALSSRAVRPIDRLALLRDCLLPAAERAGIENILVDTGVLDIPSVGWAAEAIRLVKQELGYPTGCAPANAIYMWHKLRTKGTPAFEAASSVVFTLPQILGANFVFYGPIRNAPWAYPAAAAMDAMIAHVGRLNKVRPVTQAHPLYRIF